MSSNVYCFLFAFHYHKSDCSTALYCKCISNKKAAKLGCASLFLNPGSSLVEGMDEEERKGGGEGGGGGRL